MEGFLPALVVAFQRLHPDVDFKLDMAVRFPYDRSALGDGVREIYEDMSNSHFTQKYGYAPLTVMVSAGGRHQPGKLQAIAVMVHPSNPVTSFSMGQLEQIYGNVPREGKTRIVTWGQLGLTGEWTQRPIRVYGITHFGGAPGGIFNHLVLGDRECCDDCRELTHSPPMVKAIAEDPSAIGYIAMTYAKDGVKILPIAPRDSAQPVAPTEEHDQHGTYPLSIPLYLCVNHAPGVSLDPYIKEFILLALGPIGQKAIADDGFLPLSADVVKRELVKLQ